MTNIKRIKAQQLRVGMYIAEVSDAWAKDSNLNAEGLITRQTTIDSIVTTGVADIYIDASKGLDCVTGIPLAAIREQNEADLQAVSAAPVVKPTSFAEERERALDIREDALSLVDNVMHDVKMGRSFDTQAVQSISQDIVTSVMSNQNALASLMRMRNKDTYLLEHSMNVAVLMGVLARSMNIEGQKLEELVFGAFVHDVGKIRVSEDVLYKPGRLDGDEWEEMKRHVDYGMETLKGIPGIPQVAHDICAQHHERLDGSGYPFGLKESEITVHGRMGSVVDVYDAITADRCYHKGMAPTLALRKMLEWSGDHLEKKLVYQLIRCISVYPAGTLVELQSGHLGVVLEVNATKPSRPVVKVIYNKQLAAFMPSEEVVNLAGNDKYGEIIAAAEPENFNITLKDFL